jgi:hypothetical protein
VAARILEGRARGDYFAARRLQEQVLSRYEWGNLLTTQLAPLLTPAIEPQPGAAAPASDAESEEAVRAARERATNCSVCFLIPGQGRLEDLLTIADGAVVRAKDMVTSRHLAPAVAATEAVNVEAQRWEIEGVDPEEGVTLDVQRQEGQRWAGELKVRADPDETSVQHLVYAGFAATLEELPDRLVIQDELVRSLSQSLNAAPGARGPYEAILKDADDHDKERGAWVRRPQELLDSDVPERLEDWIAKWQANGIERVGAVAMGGEGSRSDPSDDLRFESLDEQQVWSFSSTAPAKWSRLVDSQDRPRNGFHCRRCERCEGRHLQQGRARHRRVG